MQYKTHHSLIIVPAVAHIVLATRMSRHAHRLVYQVSTYATYYGQLVFSRTTTDDMLLESLHLNPSDHLTVWDTQRPIRDWISEIVTHARVILATLESEPQLASHFPITPANMSTEESFSVRYFQYQKEELSP